MILALVALVTLLLLATTDAHNFAGPPSESTPAIKGKICSALNLALSNSSIAGLIEGASSRQELRELLTQWARSDDAKAWALDQRDDFDLSLMTALLVADGHIYPEHDYHPGEKCSACRRQPLFGWPGANAQLDQETQSRFDTLISLPDSEPLEEELPAAPPTAPRPDRTPQRGHAKKPKLH